MALLHLKYKFNISTLSLLRTSFPSTADYSPQRLLVLIIPDHGIRHSSYELHADYLNLLKEPRNKARLITPAAIAPRISNTFSSRLVTYRRPPRPIQSGSFLSFKLQNGGRLLLWRVCTSLAFLQQENDFFYLPWRVMEKHDNIHIFKRVALLEWKCNSLLCRVKPKWGKYWCRTVVKWSPERCLRCPVVPRNKTRCKRLTSVS